MEQSVWLKYNYKFSQRSSLRYICLYQFPNTIGSGLGHVKSSLYHSFSLVHRSTRGPSALRDLTLTRPPSSATPLAICSRTHPDRRSTSSSKAHGSWIPRFCAVLCGAWRSTVQDLLTGRRKKKWRSLFFRRMKALSFFVVHIKRW